MSMKLTDEFVAVRRVGTPLVAVSTWNQPETIRVLTDVANGVPVLRWDVVRGYRTMNDEAEKMLSWALGDTPLEATADPITALELAEAKFVDWRGESPGTDDPPTGCVVYLTNAHSFVKDARVSTAIGNLREPFKSAAATVVLLGPSFDLPAELVQDVVLLSDPLPDDGVLGTVIDFVRDQVVESGADVAKISRPTRAAVTGALRGLSSYNAEQQTFLSLRRNAKSKKFEIDLESLWARKVEAINAVPGLEMEYARTERGSIRGLAALMTFFDRQFSEKNPERPAAILHIDEVDKALAGSGAGGGPGDSTGVTQDQIGTILQTMEDNDWDGIIPVGPPGTGKTLISKTVAGLHDVPYLRLDLGALKGSLVGESEDRIRLALETIDRIGGGRVFVIATCNRLDALPPELKRRFCSGIWYFDLPDEDQRRAIWELYVEKYAVAVTKANPVPYDAPLTGAEIRNVCRTVSRQRVTIAEAMKLIVPVSTSAREEIDDLRRVASGRFIDASAGGAYRWNSPEVIDSSGVVPRRRFRGEAFGEDKPGVN